MALCNFGVALQRYISISNHQWLSDKKMARFTAPDPWQITFSAIRTKRFDRRRIDGRVIYLDIPSSGAWTTKVLLAACADKTMDVFHNFVVHNFVES